MGIKPRRGSWRYLAEDFKNMVYEINNCSGTVEPEECLSDSVYYYNKDKDRVEVAA